MSAIKLSTPSSGSISLSPADTASNLTITVPAINATMATLTTPSFATTIGVGGATPAASGSGITFPSTASASSDANTLDDYEEGTATVRYGNGTNFTNINAPYTKVGRIVTLALSLEGLGRPAGVSTGDQIQITSLPFSMGNFEGSISTINFPIGLFVNLSGTDLGGAPKTWRWNSSTSLGLQTHTSNSTNDVSNVTFGQIANSTNFYCRTVIVYNTTS
jgi:hypothetical protein